MRIFEAFPWWKWSKLWICRNGDFNSDHGDFIVHPPQVVVKSRNQIRTRAKRPEHKQTHKCILSVQYKASSLGVFKKMLPREKTNLFAVKDKSYCKIWGECTSWTVGGLPWGKDKGAGTVGNFWIWPWTLRAG